MDSGTRLTGRYPEWCDELSVAEDYQVLEALGLSARMAVAVLDVDHFGVAGGGALMRFAPYDTIASVLAIGPPLFERDRAEDARTADPRFTFSSDSFESLSESIPFDIIYLSHELEYFSDQQAAVAKAYHLLNPGGFLVVRTCNDGASASYPDDSGCRDRAAALCDTLLRCHPLLGPALDRRAGEKCYTLFQHAGFDAVRTAVIADDTAGLSCDERKALFARCTREERRIAQTLQGGATEELSELLDEWGTLFERDDYYFSHSTLFAVGHKPCGEGMSERVSCVAADVVPRAVPDTHLNHAPFFAARTSQTCSRSVALADTGIVLRPMTERDLGGVMRIELTSFPAPWTPLAYAMELRHNDAADYQVLVAASSEVMGYIGIWATDEAVQIVHIAVDAVFSRQGWGSYLVAWACEQALARGRSAVMLEVRASNVRAIGFYESLGFVDAGSVRGFYTNPDEDALCLVKYIHG